MIAAARGHDEFAIHVTYAKGAGDLGARLDSFAHEAAHKRFAFERRADPALSVAIDLGDERVG
jgi:hypothetical protein